MTKQGKVPEGAPDVLAARKKGIPMNKRDLKRHQKAFEAREAVERNIIMSLAGQDGAAQILGYYPGGHEVDWQRSWRLAYRFQPTPEEADAYVKALRVRAREILRRPEVVKAVQVLGDVLLEKEYLTGEEATAIIQPILTPDGVASA